MCFVFINQFIVLGNNIMINIPIACPIYFLLIFSYLLLLLSEHQYGFSGEHNCCAWYRGV